ncbi:hypothetical protein [Allopontixanthobacter sp.]|uniref:hypothetical protein n=1 Tax=Allopontixanthobacter sp. TaxID=2906452 RepID=UPI002ABCC087|nr:hypothetical protein [Allopontixanthobacter sp.]MDZ4307540.1 hypothetical protein [Allopontixanthobacter sp.]
MSELPGVLGIIAAVAGDDAAVAVARARGGTQVYFPPVPPEDHWLSALIGQEQAAAVCDRLTCGVGGMRVDLPLGGAGHAAQARAQVDALLDAGLSERAIALKTGYTIRGVRRRRARLGRGGDPRQIPLF